MTGLTLGHLLALRAIVEVRGGYGHLEDALTAQIDHLRATHPDSDPTSTHLPEEDDMTTDQTDDRGDR